MELHAPASWQCVEFISDLHLHASAPRTLDALREYLNTTPANAVCILGDLFEVWVGDDCLDCDSFANQCAALLHQASQRLDVYIMCGNRDFLMGARLMQACGARVLPDPSVLYFAGQSWLLTHGDALCLDDIAYQDFRALVRSPAWQQAFLCKPLADRQAIANGIRQQSESNKRQASVYADVDTSACVALLAQHHASNMVHGHTHRPGQHVLAPGYTRTVTSDWDYEAQPTRADILRLSLAHLQGRTLQRLPGPQRTPQ